MSGDRAIKCREDSASFVPTKIVRVVDDYDIPAELRGLSQANLRQLYTSGVRMVGVENAAYFSEVACRLVLFDDSVWLLSRGVGG